MKRRNFKNILLVCSLMALINGDYAGAQESNNLLKVTPANKNRSVTINSTASKNKFDSKINNLNLIQSIEIEGNHYIDTDEILKKLNIKVGNELNKDIVQNDLKNIYDMGYFTEKLKAVPVSTPNGIKLKIRVEENVPVQGFTISGNTVLPTEEINSLMQSLRGRPQNRILLEDCISKIEEQYASKGYILAKVDQVTDDPDGIINVKINEGYINEIKVAGNLKTKDFVIKRNILTEPGSIYNENLIKKDLMRIYGTQAFSDVRRSIEISEADPQKYVVTVEVDEKRTGSVSLGGGVDTGSGLFGTFGFADKNFRGRGQEVALNAITGTGVLLSDNDIVDRANLQLEASFYEPRFRQSMNSLMVKGFGRDFASYQVPLAIEKRIGSQIVVGRAFKKYDNLSGSIGLGVENIHMKEGDGAAIANLFAAQGLNISDRAGQLVGGTFISLSPKLIYDTRDNPFNARTGVFSSVSLDEAVNLSGSADSYGALNAVVRKYVPLAQKSSLILTARAGGQLNGDMPEFAQFRLGGPRNIRGFKEGNVGSGKGYMMASAEFNTPVPFMSKLTSIKFLNDTRLAAFFDAGTIFRDSITNQLYDRPVHAMTVGTGLRFFVPGLGPINLDYGIPITNVHSNNRQNGMFTFGVGDLY